MAGSENVLCPAYSFFGGFLTPVDGLFVVALDSSFEVVAFPQPVLSLGIALLCRRCEIFGGRFVFLGEVCLFAFAGQFADGRLLGCHRAGKEQGAEEKEAGCPR